MPPSCPYVLIAVLLLAACATGGGDKPTHTVEAVGKVIDSLAAETARRVALDGYRGLPAGVSPASQTGNTVELIVAEFLRTRLLEQGITVHKVCAAPPLGRAPEAPPAG